MLRMKWILLGMLLMITLAEEVQKAEEEYVYLIFKKQCYQSLVGNGIMNGDCWQDTFFKFLGYGLVAGGAVVKIPQVVKILMDASVFGISYSSIALEACTNWVNIVYSWDRNIPFNIYGENVFIIIQNIVIMAFFCVYPGWNFKVYGSFLAVFLAAIYATSNPTIWPEQVVDGAMSLQILLFSSARVSQIYHIWKHKSTGSLAFITFFLVFMGNLARLLTVCMEVSDDIIMMVSIFIAATLNGIILFQFILYWNSKPNIQEKPKSS